MVIDKNKNPVKNFAKKTLPFLLLLYFICFRSYFLLQQFDVANQVSKIANHVYSLDLKDFSSKIFAQEKGEKTLKISPNNFLQDHEFVKIQITFFGLFLAIFLFFFRDLIFAPTNPAPFQNRAPPIVN